MAEPPWLKLVARLKQQGHESRYLERLEQRLPQLAAITTVSDVEREIAQEMASSLGRAADKVNVALLELEVIGAQIDDLARRSPARAPVEIAARVEQFNTQREIAVRCLWELRVQRECIGIRRNEDLARDYPIPPRRAR